MTASPSNSFSINSVNSSIFLLIFMFIAGSFSTASLNVLPHPCDNVKCPPMSEITCPDDSDIRETLRPIALLNAATAAPADDTFNTSAIAEELYSQCCLTKKCICKTCYIPDCHNEGEVVVELIPESPETPGNCCGFYECQREPNCTLVRDTENFWLTDCQRCRCYGGERMCHQSCDEGIKKPTAICNSKNLNTFFEHGQTWKDGCYECECVNGEEKCVLPFCRSVNCPPHRQVMLKDSCCPVCWPKGIPMPNGDEDFEDENDDDEDDYTVRAGSGNYDDNDDDDDDKEQPIIDLQPAQPTDETNMPLQVLLNGTTAKISTTTTTAKTTTEFIAEITTQQSKSAAMEMGAINSSEKPPCMVTETPAVPATYHYPEVVEVVRQTHQNDLLYAIIGCLALVVVALAAWNINLRAKQRSYRPVSNFDDNFNKMSSNIKKMNDYV